VYLVLIRLFRITLNQYMYSFRVRSLGKTPFHILMLFLNNFTR